MTRGPVWASTSAAPDVAAVASPPTPALFRKSRRLTPKGSSFFDIAMNNSALGRPAMQARRDFLRHVVPAGALGFIGLKANWLERVASATAALADRAAADVAADEAYWREIQQAFTLDRTILNLNNGYTCPSPRVVHEALKRYLDMSNQAPIHYMWNLLEPNVETVRRNLAAEAGCDTEELAITRNATEGLRIAQLGMDLQPGDEVVTTNQDYGRMIDTWEQRVRRDRIKLTKISFPVPTKNLSELTARFEQAITPKTRVIH